MRFKNRNNRQGRAPNRKQINRNEIQLSKRINLFSESTLRNVSLFTAIEGNVTSHNYTFVAGADTRFISFAAICASTEFTNMALNYQNYRIIKCDITLSPTYISSGNVFPMLVVDIQPTIAPANPVNTDVIQSDSSRYFSPLANYVDTVSWSLPGTGLSTNIWLDTGAVSSLGQFVIGSNNTNIPILSATTQFDVKLDLLIQFSNPK
jgi:hypothetical protein